LKNALLDTYDVSEEQAFADARRVAAEWQEIGLVS
jgi:hypothetical protein